MPGKKEVEVKFWTVRGQASRRGVVAPLDAGAFLLRETSGASNRIPFSSTQSMSFNDHGKGAMIGFIAGAASGALVGFIAGSAYGGVCRSSDTPCSAQDRSMEIGGIGALIGGLSFGLLGGVIGALAGYRTTLTF